MTASEYHRLSLDWSPQSPAERQFKLISLVVVSLMLLLGLMVSSINLPEKKREPRVEVPERIANLLLEKKKQRPQIKQPKPEPVKAKPKPKPKKDDKPKVTKITRPKTAAKPLTKGEKQARKKAENSGLLALANELSDLMDTDEISNMVGGQLSTGSASGGSNATNPGQLLIADTVSGSGGVDNSAYSTRVGQTRLSLVEVQQVQQALIKPETVNQPSSANALKSRQTKSTRAGARAEEEVTLVFDQNKSALFNLYNRARRKNPGLKGKIILRITIAPSGEVSKLAIVSSELNDHDLEKRLLRRIKSFKFAAKDVEPVTVTYPIEFLPS